MATGRPCRLLLPLTLLAALAATPRAALAPPAEPRAMIAATRGKVEVRPAKGGQPQRAVFGRSLERGDRVKVGAGGAATVFFDDGSLIELAEKKALTVGERQAPARSAAGPAGLSAEVFILVERFVTAGPRPGGPDSLSAWHLGADPPPLCLEPRETDLLIDRPTLVWRAVEGARRYRVTVANERGTVWIREEIVPRLAFPMDVPPLDHDSDYRWEVEALGERGSLRRESSTFRVVAPDVAATVAANLKLIRESTGGPQTPASAFLTGSYLSALRLHLDAIHEFETLGELAPDSPAPHEALGRVYRAVGLGDLAAAEFRQALALGRRP